jgi:propionate CoA-transferase
MNARTTEEIVRLMQIDGEDVLFFKAFPINVALIRGTTADPDGNITTERESLSLENLALAIAARNSGGIVIAQVERVAAEGSLDARRVKVPGILVDCVVLTEPEYHMQTYGTQFSPAFAGELRVPQKKSHPVALSERKIIARRAALELSPNCVINVGVGTVPDQVPLVAGEERVQDLITLTVDPGVMGGVPMSGLDFGAAVNYQAVIDHCSEFDFIDGGGLALVQEDFRKKPEVYKALKAFVDDRVYALLPFNWYTTNIDTALADAYAIGKILYPKPFEDVDPEPKADEIYAFLVGKPVYPAMKKDYGVIGAKPGF